ncbi:hypothetical protein Slin15195_G081430 [Septoria linicola]|uniref:Uncharacterized protein n=1 Tax=Septoria linicola TaxID=215465 RepID=A0A9Q9ELX5_9PEZI|nr:hypothetical protein Slin15195_G081430 [Septoria linicola]
MSPFTGAFARFPYVSALPPRQSRITLVAVWNDDYVPSYLRQFYYTIQKNADTVDLLLVNRLITPGKPCLDFKKAGIDITWGGNVKVICIDDKTWKQHFVDFMCSSDYGWACGTDEYQAVLNEFTKRRDAKNYEWRPFLGYAFRQHFANPDLPFWGWVDQDSSIGDFRRYPFNILSQVSLMTGRERFPAMMMAGQLTTFNFDDHEVGTAWKKFIGLRDPQDFIAHAKGEFPNSPEERYWSEGYLRSDPSSPGSNLSFVIYPGLHADDFFRGLWGVNRNLQAHILSGRDIITLDTTYSRSDIEAIIKLEREKPIDDTGGIGWTGGEDGSAYLLKDPKMSSEVAKALAVHNSPSRSTKSPPKLNTGLLTVETVLTDATCQADRSVRFIHQCIPAHPLSRTTPQIYRESIVRLKEQDSMKAFRRLERDDRPRGYERKLIRHHLQTLSHGDSYGKGWFELPPFDVTDDMVLRSNNDFVEVWKMGEEREKTLFFRAPKQKPIG